MLKKHQSLINLARFFPALAAKNAGDHAYYFDNAATACTLAPAVEAIKNFYENAHGSVHRGVYHSAEQTTTEYEKVRSQTAAFINAHSSDEIIFTSGTTDSVNTVAYVWAQYALNPGDGIIITQAEHHAHYVLWHEIARRYGAFVYVLPIDPITFCVELSGVDHLLTKSIKVVAVTTCSNVLGPIWGAHSALLYTLIKKARSVGAAIVIDAAQTIAHAPIDVQELDCDFLAFSVHKMGGPTGLGVLYARKKRHSEMKPYRFGGGMVAAIADDYMVWQAAPHCFEAGTPPIAQVVGLGAVLDFYTNNVDFALLQQHEATLCAQLIAGLKNIPGVHLVGNADLLSRSGHVVTWYVDGVHAHDLATTLGTYRCCLRAGDHCAHPISALWNKKATIRASFFMYNSAAEVEYLIASIADSITRWRAIL
jgi:cysteine desulfurase/selenocysteine lyase